MKGKLIGEIKERFFENNKVGWQNFCEEFLNMNYTTANQYVRVSQEFDVTSHRGDGFGFEHFKALLPLPSEARAKVLEIIPKNISVKQLRQEVAKRIYNSESKQNYQENIQTGFRRENKIKCNKIVEDIKNLIANIQELKKSDLTQNEKWILSGAFAELSFETFSITEVLNDKRFNIKEDLPTLTEPTLQSKNIISNDINKTEIVSAVV